MKYNPFGKPKPYWSEGYAPVEEYSPKDVLSPPTFNLELKVGEEWYVKQKDRNDLIVFKILEVTEKTVFVEDHNMGWQHIRYKKSDIEFVEKVQ